MKRADLQKINAPTGRGLYMQRLWIVEAMFDGGVWEICWFGLGVYQSTNFYKAHEIKRKQQKWLQEHGSDTWTKNRFRVVEYVRRDKVVNP